MMIEKMPGDVPVVEPVSAGSAFAADLSDLFANTLADDASSARLFTKQQAINTALHLQTCCGPDQQPHV
ncbi:MAG: hypothetical protein JNM70_24290 [Anaerolineae bacterium]|nr:hypothetical protein [Anaerolineae bacterium]